MCSCSPNNLPTANRTAQEVADDLLDVITGQQSPTVSVSSTTIAQLGLMLFLLVSASIVFGMWVHKKM